MNILRVLAPQEVCCCKYKVINVFTAPPNKTSFSNFQL